MSMAEAGKVTNTHLAEPRSGMCCRLPRYSASICHAIWYSGRRIALDPASSGAR